MQWLSGWQSGPFLEVSGLPVFGLRFSGLRLITLNKECLSIELELGPIELPSLWDT